MKRASLKLCTFLISGALLLTQNARGWIKVYESKGVIHIVGVGEKRFKRPKNYESVKEKAVKYAEKYGIPPRLFVELIRAESNFNPRAVSPKGAMGLCQLMPETAKRLGVKDPFNPDQNMEAGAKLLRELYDKYGDWKLALAAYNAGEKAVEKYGGVPPYRETKNYVRKIMRRFKGKEKRSKPRYRIVVVRKNGVIVIANEWER